MSNLIIFASGTGSNARKIIDYFRHNNAVKISLIVSNKADAGVLNIAREEGIPTLLIEKERFFRGDGYIPELLRHQPHLIILAGFLWKLPPTLVQAFPRRIINIHPALLPKYGGKGMYGHYVHEAVKAANEPESGITIHYVDELYDHGEYIHQSRVSLDPEDDPTTIARKVLQLEHYWFPRVIESLLNSTAK